MTNSWALRAPCHGIGAFAPNEDAWSTQADLLRMCQGLLGTCGPCPFRAECIATIKPVQAMFDGIAGGRLWCNGVVIAALEDVSDAELAEPKLRASCGTEAGARDHNRHGERACAACRQVARQVTARRKEEKARQPGQLALDIAV
ncbi:hypothetical protein ACFWVC_26895 [Streptomyces sp. NPDC058691]|uniref:hypothetical protein n=1 Tax=Streptomyces sp. NPDC058691 TaxID=3346601 RepID=UPI00364F8D43